LRRPYRGRGLRYFQVIQCSGANEHEVRPGFGFAEKLCTALAAKPPMHLVAAVGDALKIPEFAVDGERIAGKTGIDGPAAGSKVLADTTPTDARDNGRSRDLVAHGPAQAPSGDQHDNSLPELRIGTAIVP
jgi:hypothetical protein